MRRWHGSVGGPDTNESGTAGDVGCSNMIFTMLCFFFIIQLQLSPSTFWVTNAHCICLRRTHQSRTVKEHVINDTP